MSSPRELRWVLHLAQMKILLPSRNSTKTLGILLWSTQACFTIRWAHSMKQNPHCLELSRTKRIILARLPSLLFARGQTARRWFRSFSPMLYLLSNSYNMASADPPSPSLHLRQTYIPTSATTSFTSKYFSVSSYSRASLKPEQGGTAYRNLRPGKIWWNFSTAPRGGRERRAKRLQVAGQFMGYTCTARLLRSRKQTVWQSPPGVISPLSSNFLKEWWFWPSPFSQSRFTRSEQSADGRVFANFSGSRATVLCYTSLANCRSGSPTASPRPIPPSHTAPSSLTSNGLPCTHDSQNSLSISNTPIFSRTCLAWASIQRMSIFSRIYQQFCAPFLELMARRSFMRFRMLLCYSAMRLSSRVRYCECCSFRSRAASRNDSLCFASSTPQYPSNRQMTQIELTSDSNSTPSSISQALQPCHRSLEGAVG